MLITGIFFLSLGIISGLLAGIDVAPDLAYSVFWSCIALATVIFAVRLVLSLGSPMEHERDTVEPEPTTPLA
jgi:hypothetical protein